MSNLDRLAAKIIEDANIKAEAILKEAKDNGDLTIKNKTKKAEAIKEQMLEKSKIEATTVRQRVLSNTQLVVRNDKLSAMQQSIDKVFKRALEKLLNIDEKQYLDLVKAYILSMDIDGDEKLIIPEKYKNTVNNEYLTEINETLLAKGKKGELQVSSEPTTIQSGFVLVKNGIEINTTFEGLVNSLRDELEPEIIKELFYS